MNKGRNNKLAGQIGEYLVCAELGRRGLIATPFSGNVPAFDVLAADALCRTVPIQVKASRSDNWPSDARNWMRLSLDEATGVQKYLVPVEITNPNLIYVFVAIASPGGGYDRFFILTKAQMQDICIKNYSAWMDKLGWKRPRNPASYHFRHYIHNVQQYENNWQIVTDRLNASTFAQSLQSSEEEAEAF